jgi:Peptidase family M28
MQDFFGIIPGDTDYRMFAEDYGKIPGLDIIFVLGGYFYHTSFDTVENLMYMSNFSSLYNLNTAFVRFVVLTLVVLKLGRINYLIRRTKCFFFTCDQLRQAWTYFASKWVYYLHCC